MSDSRLLRSGARLVPVLPTARPPVLRSLQRRLLGASFASLAAALPAWPQGSAASESGVVTAMATASSGGSSVGQVTGGQLSASVGQPATGDVATSPSYRVHTGVAWSATSFGPNVPLVTGTRPALGDKDGGEVVTVFGFNFTAAGAGVNNVTFDGNAAASPVTVGNTRVRVNTPAGLNLAGNALTDVDVEVSNAIGTHKAVDAFNYTPSMQTEVHAQLNKGFKMRIHGPSNGLYILWLGDSTYPAGIATPPFEGQFVLLGGSVPLFTIGFGSLDSDGIAEIDIAMPSNTPLIGFVMEFQPIVSNATTTDVAWSNYLPVVIKAED